MVRLLLMNWTKRERWSNERRGEETGWHLCSLVTLSSLSRARPGWALTHQMKRWGGGREWRRARPLSAFRTCLTPRLEQRASRTLLSLSPSVCLFLLQSASLARLDPRYIIGPKRPLLKKAGAVLKLEICLFLSWVISWSPVFVNVLWMCKRQQRFSHPPPPPPSPPETNTVNKFLLSSSHYVHLLVLRRLQKCTRSPALHPSRH